MPDSTRKAAATQFRAEYGTQWTIAWHEKAETPATLMGGTTRGYTGPPEQAGRAFLQDHHTLFGIENAQQNLEVARTNASRGNTRVLYGQVYRGLPVLYSGYLVAVNDAGAIYYVSGDYYPDLNVPTIVPSLSPSGVVRQIRSDLGGTASFKLLQEPLLSIYVNDESKELSYHLAYEVRAERRDPLEAYKYVIDAQNGNILQKISLIEVFHSSTTAIGKDTESRVLNGISRIDGSGEVYLTNPLHGSPVSVTLHRLDNVSPRVLEGNNIAVTNEEAADATSATGTFNYSPSNTHFDEVMVYYHSDEFEDWLVSDLGMSSNQLTCQVAAETHSSDAYASTIPSQCDVFYADQGIGLGNPTREAVIIAHEYMHIVSETYNTLTQSFNAGALDEGYSDFFAVSNRHANTSVSSTRLGAFVGLAAERTVDNTYQLGDFLAGGTQGDLDNNGNYSEHDGGVVLAGALWDFQQAISDVSEAAELTLESLSYLDGNPSFLDARDALLAAANAAGQSQYESDIFNAFANHGIGSPLSASITGPSCVVEDEPASWTTYPAGGLTPYSYEWEYYIECGAGGGSLFGPPDECGVWHAGSPSQQFVYTPTSTNYLRVRLTVTDDIDDSDTETQFVIVEEDGPNACSGQRIASASASLEAADGAIDASVPTDYALSANYPNPFNPSTEIRFALPEAAEVHLVVYDALGREVARLMDGAMEAGHHRATFDATGLPSGVYLYRLTAGNFVETQRMVLMK